VDRFLCFLKSFKNRQWRFQSGSDPVVRDRPAEPAPGDLAGGDGPAAPGAGIRPAEGEAVVGDALTLKLINGLTGRDG